MHLVLICLRSNVFLYYVTWDRICSWFYYVVFLGVFAKLLKVRIRVTSPRPSAWNYSAPTGKIFMKFYILVFLENLRRKLKFC
jgi:hypothetical protein